MYQFTTTNVINSALDSNGSLAKFAGANGVLKVARVNAFKKANVVSIYKKAYTAGVKEIAKVQIPTITAGLVARLTVDVRLAQQTNSEYANVSLDFKKPVTVEVIATGTAATDAAALVAQLNGLRDRFGYAYITAAVVTTDYVQVTATDKNQRINSMLVEKEKASTNSIIQPEYENVTGSTFSVTTSGVTGFGDDDWMLRSIVVPTRENTRYYGLSKDERPVLGGNYSQYTLRYAIENQYDAGVFGGSNSITTHVFYVISGQVSAFETAISDAGLTLLTAPSAAGTFAVTISDSTLSILSGDLAQLFPTNFKGVVTYADTAGSGTVTISASGVVTPTVAGATTITATDTFTGGTQTATVSLTVVA